MKYTNGRRHLVNVTGRSARRGLGAGPSALQWRYNHRILALTDALRDLVRWDLLPHHRFNTSACRRSSTASLSAR
jgi:hypothetical protein